MGRGGAVGAQYARLVEYNFVMELNFFEDAPNYGAVELVRKPLQEYFDEVAFLLPELPKKLSIWLDNTFLVRETGEGGAAYSPEIINISFDVDFKNKESQLADLRGTIFHETYHLVQGHTFFDGKAKYRSMLDSAIYEGCVTVFEREYAGVSPLWGEYKQHSEEELKKWRDAMAVILPKDYIDGKDGLRDKWAFYDKEDGQRWKMYKTGSWLVDRTMEKSKMTILQIRKISAKEIVLS